MRKIIAILILPFCTFISCMSITIRLQKANDVFEQQHYTKAIEQYLEILDKADITEAKINLAACYRKIGNIAEMEYWYGQIIYTPAAKPIFYKHYGEVLIANGKCDLAEEWLEKYEQITGDTVKVSLMANCIGMKWDAMSPHRNKFYEIWHLPFNTKYHEFSPVFYKNQAWLSLILLC